MVFCLNRASSLGILSSYKEISLVSCFVGPLLPLCVFIFCFQKNLRITLGSFGEVVDRMTGKPRGFGFVTFADSAVAEKVLEENHVIDDRKVN